MVTEKGSGLTNDLETVLDRAGRSSDGESDVSAAHAQRQSLARLREKLVAQAGTDAGEGTPHTREELVQVQFALAKRQLDDGLRADFGDRERLAEAHLRVPWQSIAVSSEHVVEPHIKPVLRLISRQLAEHREVEFAGAKPGSPPRWDRFELGDEVDLVLAWATIYWDARTVSDVPLVLETWDNANGQAVLVFSRPEDHEKAKTYLDGLISNGKGPSSPYRGRLLKASWGLGGVRLEILPDPLESRDQLILPRAIWEALDINVHRMLERMPVFRAAGLGSNRGILLAGPPGTGKTAACKVLAREVLGDATAVFVDSRVGQGLLQQLYTEIAGLAPALLLLEDLDLLVGAREDNSERWALVDFLTVLDGLMTQHRDVVTVATTNDPQAIDAGVRRAARFDRVITFPLPNERTREQILNVYLHSVDHSVNTSKVAEATEGKTGADLREYVRAALLTATDSLTTDDLLRVVQDGVMRGSSSERPSSHKGKYL